MELFTKWFINCKQTSKSKLNFIEWIGELKSKNRHDHTVLAKSYKRITRKYFNSK